jgi:hypothetical protein
MNNKHENSLKNIEASIEPMKDNLNALFKKINKFSEKDQDGINNSL